jgi:large subunit ribosomal protein L10Ae|eukprot:CAMPEP_0174283640 /NCGR_PEP_ID=MMETSP0809-20121228/4356_1 /TAXON_ID=73025 ORGANISM="Eutreptiella gymnastica-like, Strain CCMP1594" /NCGR_SAMPLE_ID=MMETSP0809 /ASSEMBLY_ACC=CAM_ASM_000658 /LENGTH=220 /DNA_ID=CAMNT_0015378701 /DNA_START=32 /DNA_END=694 /DNA_ORIENTATION=+
MSKINATVLQEAVQAIIDGSHKKSGKAIRKFPESVDLQVNLKNYDTQKDKRFSGTVKLPRIARPRFKVCIIADAAHADAAQKLGIPMKTVDDLKKLNKNKKLVKKMCQEHDAFLASDSLIKTIPRIVGPHMNRAGKFPSALSSGEDIMAKINEIRSTIKFQLKKVLCMGCCVGHVEMSPDDLKLNVTLAINFLVSLLKKNWQNLKSVHIKSTMGKSQRIF